jgi:hypothetical protein
MAAAPDRPADRAKLVRVADTETIAQLGRHVRLRVATAPVVSQAVTRRLDTETIAMMGPVRQVAHVPRMAALVATEAAAAIRAAATERHAVAVLVVQVVLAAAVGVQ